MQLHQGLEFDQITVPHPGQPREEVILVRTGETVHAYRNHCPHAGANLDWGDGRCLQDDGTLLCSLHGAIFDPATGECIDGPGTGRFLERVPIIIDGDRILIDAGE